MQHDAVRPVAITLPLGTAEGHPSPETGPRRAGTRRQSQPREPGASDGIPVGPIERLDTVAERGTSVTFHADVDGPSELTEDDLHAFTHLLVRRVRVP